MCVLAQYRAKGMAFCRKRFTTIIFFHTDAAYSAAGSVSTTVQESFFPFGVPTSGEHCAACSLVGDPGFAFAVFYWWAYGYTQETSGCALVNTYEPGGMAATQYAYAKGITPCATTTACGVSEGTCSYID